MPQQIVIHEGLILLIRQIRLDHRIEEFGILSRQEETQFMAGILGIVRSLFFRI